MLALDSAVLVITTRFMIPAANGIRAIESARTKGLPVRSAARLISTVRHSQHDADGKNVKNSRGGKTMVRMARGIDFAGLAASPAVTAMTSTPSVTRNREREREPDLPSIRNRKKVFFAVRGEVREPKSRAQAPSRRLRTSPQDDKKQ